MENHSSVTGSSGRKRERAPRVSPSRAPVLSFAHYFQAPASQAILIQILLIFGGRQRCNRYF